MVEHHTISTSIDKTQFKRTRNRPVKSCTECNRRKQKCDRRQPCRHCVSRKIEERCIYHDLKSKAFPKRREYPKSSAGSELDEHTDSESGQSRVDIRLGHTEHERSSALRELESSIATFRIERGNNGPSSLPKTLRARIQQLMPKKTVIDDLITTFFRQINRIYEMIYEPVFMQQYNDWFAQYDQSIISDIDFALLILRLCSLSAQISPYCRNSDKRNTSFCLNSARRLERKLYHLATDFESQRPRKYSILTVQHIFFHVCYLKNKSQIKDSWLLLADAIKIAHEIGLHLEKGPDSGFSELDRELRRRTFWNLYVWDRFMCSFLGRWPLIPEEHCDVDIPHDTIQVVTTSPVQLTGFTDRIFHIRAARFISSTMGTRAWIAKHQYDPVMIDRYVQRFQTELLDLLPPSLRLLRPDETWNIVFPSLDIKRKSLHLALFAVQAGLYRGFSNPWKSEDEGGKVVSSMAVSYYERLITSLDNILLTAIALHQNKDSESEKTFMIPMTIIEALPRLGLCFVAVQSPEACNWMMQNKEWGEHIKARLQKIHITFDKAYALLEQQATISSIARYGMKILSSLAAFMRSYDFEVVPAAFRIATEPSSLRARPSENNSTLQSLSTFATAFESFQGETPLYQEYDFNETHLEEFTNLTPPSYYGIAEDFDWVQFAASTNCSWVIDEAAE